MNGGTKLDRFERKKSVSTGVLDMYFQMPPWLFGGADFKGAQIRNFKLNFFRG